MEPYITPQNIGLQELSKEYRERIIFAYICMCPLPEQFEHYIVEQATERHFIHIHPNHVFFGKTEKEEGVHFMVISEVYGYAVTASLVEELYYYGIRSVIGIGFCGMIDAPNDRIGHVFNIHQTNNVCQVAEPYTISKMLSSSKELSNIFNQIHKMDIYTTLNFYREYPKEVDKIKDKYELVSMDAVGLFAPQYKLKMSVAYLTVVSDIINTEGSWHSTLSENVDQITNQHQDSLVKLVVENCGQKVYNYSFMSIMDSYVYDALRDRDASHGYDHIKRVVRLSEILYEKSGQSDNKKFLITMLAAWLHDINDHKYSDSVDISPIIFRFLPEQDFRKVCSIIDNVSFSKEVMMINKGGKYPYGWCNKDSLEECLELRNIVSDADKIDALGSSGFNRCATYIKHKNPGLSEKSTFERLLDHCDEKLFKLHTDFVHTPYGKTLAKIGYQELVKVVAKGFYEHILRIQDNELLVLVCPDNKKRKIIHSYLDKLNIQKISVYVECFDANILNRYLKCKGCSTSTRVDKYFCFEDEGRVTEEYFYGICSGCSEKVIYDDLFDQDRVNMTYARNVLVVGKSVHSNKHSTCSDKEETTYQEYVDITRSLNSFRIQKPESALNRKKLGEYIAKTIQI